MKLPRTVAADFSGEIVGVGQGEHADWVKEGVRVYGIHSADKALKTGKGSLSSYLTISSRYVVPTPQALEDEKAAGIALTGLTALSLNETLQKGWKVFIVGGSTSVGLAAADIARAKGASLIVASASGEKKKLLQQRGVDEVIDCECALQQRPATHSSAPTAKCCRGARNGCKSIRKRSLTLFPLMSRMHLRQGGGRGGRAGIEAQGAAFRCHLRLRR